MALKVRVALEAAAGRDRGGGGGRQGPPGRRLRGHAASWRGRRSDGSALLAGLRARPGPGEGQGRARSSTPTGRRYLDFAAGIGVNGLGYGDRKVVAADPQAGRAADPREQPVPEPAGAGAGGAPGRAGVPVQGVLHELRHGGGRGAPSSSRASIGREQGRTELIAFERSFHGRTMGALSLTWTAKYREPFEPLVPGVALPALGRPRRRPSARIGAAAPRRCSSSPCRARAASGRRPRVPARRCAELCRERGALLVCRRGPVRPGPHRQAVRLPARRHHARHPDAGQAAGRRAAAGRGAAARGAGGRARTSGTTAARSAATRWRPRPRWPCSTA